MIRLLLDTTFLIDAERGESLDDLIADDDDVAIAAVTVAELLVGIEMADGRRKLQRREFVDGVIDALSVIPYDLAVASHHSVLLASVQRDGRPRGAHDLIIAATALASSREVLTADPGGFEALPGVSLRPHR